MTRAFQEAFKILSAAVANGAGSAMDVSDFRHLVIGLHTSGSAAATIKVQGSLQETQPTWTSAASATNQWGYVQIISLDDQTPVTGSTGIVMTGTDANTLYEVNTNGLKWLNFIISSRSAGTFTVVCKPFNDTE